MLTTGHLGIPGGGRSTTNLSLTAGTGSRIALNAPGSVSSSQYLGGSSANLGLTASTLNLLNPNRISEAAKKRLQPEEDMKVIAPTTPSRGLSTSGGVLRRRVSAIVENRERDQLLNHLRSFKEAQNDRKREEIARVAAMAVNIQMNGHRRRSDMDDYDDDEQNAGFPRVVVDGGSSESLSFPVQEPKFAWNESTQNANRKLNPISSFDGSGSERGHSANPRKFSNQPRKTFLHSPIQELSPASSSHFSKKSSISNESGRSRSGSRSGSFHLLPSKDSKERKRAVSLTPASAMSFNSSSKTRERSVSFTPNDAAIFSHTSERQRASSLSSGNGSDNRDNSLIPKFRNRSYSSSMTSNQFAFPNQSMNNKDDESLHRLAVQRRMLSTAHEVSESNASSLAGSIEASLTTLSKKYEPASIHPASYARAALESKPPLTTNRGIASAPPVDFARRHSSAGSVATPNLISSPQSQNSSRRGSMIAGGPFNEMRRGSGIGSGQLGKQQNQSGVRSGYGTQASSANPSRRGSLKRSNAPAISVQATPGSVNHSRRGSLSGSSTAGTGKVVSRHASISAGMGAGVTETMKRKASLRGVAIAVKMTVRVGSSNRRHPFGGTFLTSVNGIHEDPRLINYGTTYAFHRFKRVARLVTILINFAKFLSRILKNPIQWGWEHDPDAHLFGKIYNNGKSKVKGNSGQRGIISTDFSVSKLFNTQKVFKGWLPEQMRELFRKPARMRNDNDISEMQVWASGMKAFKEFQPAVQKMLLKVGRYERWHAGRTIVKEGHIAMNYYILLDGEIEVSRVNRDLVDTHLQRFIEEGIANGKSEDEIDLKDITAELERVYTDLLGTQSSGESFGELAFINGNIRLASVTTRRTTEFLIIERHHFERVMSMAQDTDIREKMLAMKEVAIFRTLSVNLNNLARYVDVRTYPPNGVVVCEGDLCEYIYFLRSGTCRVIKAIPFLKIPISRDKFVFRPIHFSYKDSLESAEFDATTAGTTVTTKFVVVQHLHPGDHFYDGDSSKTPRELYLASGLGTSASRTSVVANLKTEILRISKLDFNKFATKSTWKAFVEMSENAMPPLERLSEAYMAKRDWEVYKRKIVEEVVRRIRWTRRTQLEEK
ncbi:hypothetical protein HDU97_001966 [Phlyctochytrium planicorne]|nr:hypothetical protein HDU97_001966 [Phlyctochytrium planicorne]